MNDRGYIPGNPSGLPGYDAPGEEAYAASIDTDEDHDLVPAPPRPIQLIAPSVPRASRYWIWFIAAAVLIGFLGFML